MSELSRLPLILERYEDEILKDWIREQLHAVTYRKDILKETELKQQSADFLRSLRQAAQTASSTNVMGAEWTSVRELLTEISRARAQKNFSPTDTATFVLSLKQPLFSRFQRELAREPELLFAEIWNTSTLLDKLGLYTTELHQKTREELINRQQQEMIELSTPVIKLWEGVLGLPMIGTLDSRRSQTVMENLLQAIVDQCADVAIIDITGVPAVDTLTAQHLLKTIAAARLMGAECIISGIRPQIAQTIVHLGIDLRSVQTKATLAEALTLALRYRGLAVRPIAAPAAGTAH